MKPTKFREPSARQVKSMDRMIEIGFKFKDHLGEPYFIPKEWWGYYQNFKCQKTKADFEAELRKYA